MELDRDQKLAVHEYWLNADTLAYFPAPSHPVHHDRLVTELPFPVGSISTRSSGSEPGAR
ncbi:hypothetical protein ABZ235_02685 [Streptomyces canus]|uniref:hypothetical protein n=1 Tax=Streptomyces canus TaxID=58343 RepID=UPI0033B9C7D0